MYNYIVSYDLNGRFPTHAQMDAHIRAGSYRYGRILETVWFVQSALRVQELAAYLGRVLSPNDRLMVVEGGAAVFKNLLIKDQEVINAWNGQRAA